MDNVTRIWVDETSKKKGHNYISPVVDMDKKDILFIAEGKWADVLLQFAKDLFAHWWDSENITEVSMDLWPSFISGAKKYFWKADIVYDRFHVMKIMNDGLDKLRKRITRWDKSLQRTKMLFLVNKQKLGDKQSERLQEILAEKVELSEGYSFKLLLQDVYNTSENKDEATENLETLIGLMRESELPEMKKIAKSLNRHMNWILNYWIRKTTNAILEWMNSQIQTIKRIARGFKNLDYFKSIIYIRLWRLNLSCINPLL